MAVAYVVDVAAFHKEHLMLHLLARYIMTGSRIVLVAVNTLHLYRLSIEIIVAASKSKFVFIGRCILNLYLSETNNGRESLNHIALFVLKLAH